MHAAQASPVVDRGAVLTMKHSGSDSALQQLAFSSRSVSDPPQLSPASAAALRELHARLLAVPSLRLCHSSGSAQAHCRLMEAWRCCNDTPLPVLAATRLQPLSCI